MTSISIHIIANQSSYHDDKSTLQCFTCVFCPQPIRNVRSRRRIDRSSIIAHSVNSDLSHTWEGSLKCYAKNSTYIYIFMTLLIIDMDFQPGIDCTTFHSFFSWKVWKKKVFQNFRKLAGLWLVGEVDNHVAIYGSKVAEGFYGVPMPVLLQISSVSLLISNYVLSHQVSLSKWQFGITSLFFFFFTMITFQWYCSVLLNNGLWVGAMLWILVTKVAKHSQALVKFCEVFIIKDNILT